MDGKGCCGDLAVMASDDDVGGVLRMVGNNGGGSGGDGCSGIMLVKVFMHAIN